VQGDPMQATLGSVNAPTRTKNRVRTATTRRRSFCSMTGLSRRGSVCESLPLPLLASRDAGRRQALKPTHGQLLRLSIGQPWSPFPRRGYKAAGLLVRRITGKAAFGARSAVASEPTIESGKKKVKNSYGKQLSS